MFRKVDDVTGIAVLTHNLGELAQDSGDRSRAAVLYAESLQYFETAGHIWGIAYNLHKLAGLALESGELVHATELLQQALLTMHDQGDRRGIAWCFESLAGVAAKQRRPERAAELWAAAASMRATIGVPIPPADEPDYRRAVDAARAQLDMAAWDAAWNRGLALPVSHAIVFALEGGEYGRA